MKKILIIIIILLIQSVLINAQVQQEWVSRYNGIGNFYDNPISCVVDDSGSVYVTGGSCAGSGYGTGDIVTIKYSTNGNQGWLSRYNGPRDSTDYGTSIVVDKWGNIIITGVSVGIGTSTDYCTIKYNSSGVEQWLNRYNGPASSIDDATCVDVDEFGNIYVTGTSKDVINEYCTIKYNADGVQKWIARYHGTQDISNTATCIKVYNSNSIYITGTCNRQDGGDYCTIRYDSNGVQQWVQRFSEAPTGSNFASSLAFDAFGNIVITGTANHGNTSSSCDICTLKYNSNGVQQWVAIYDSPEQCGDAGFIVAVDKQDNIYVGGATCDENYNMGDYCLIKYNSSGIQQWLARYNGPASDIDNITAMVLDTSGNIYVSGNSDGIGTSTDFCTIKYNPSGVQQWLIRYNGPVNGQDRVNSMGIDKQNNIYVVGSSFGGPSNDDYCTVKYSQVIGIKPISTTIPKEFALYQNYPNPFNPSTKIKFNIPLSPLSERGVGGFVTLKIYDLLGQEITTLVNQQLQPGTYEVSWDATKYSSGIYFYKLSAGDFSESKKMILLK